MTTLVASKDDKNSIDSGVPEVVTSHHFNETKRRKSETVTNNALNNKFSQNTQDSPQVHPQTNHTSLGATFDVFCRFSRIYSLKGSVLGIISSCLLAIESPSDFTPSFFYGVLLACVGGCLANSFAVSINQVADVEIDKVNKPYLPLASGELSVKNGILLTALYAVLGLCLSLYVQSWPMRLSLLIWYALATAYSVDLPLLRWKAIPLLTLMAIWSFRGVFIPIMFYLHAQVYIFGRPLLLSKHVIFSSGLMSTFAVAIALFKDLSDVEGDMKNGIKTFASEFGLKQVFWICIWLLEMAFGIAIVIGLSSTNSWIKSIMVISHMILAYILWKNAKMVDLKRKKDFESFYMLIWKLLYVEYLLMPILRF